jgi:hypothetical protein
MILDRLIPAVGLPQTSGIERVGYERAGERTA